MAEVVIKDEALTALKDKVVIVTGMRTTPPSHLNPNIYLPN